MCAPARWLERGPPVTPARSLLPLWPTWWPPSRPTRKFTSSWTTFLLIRPSESSRFWPSIQSVTVQYTPTYSSWLNQVEIWFTKIQRDLIARGIFESRLTVFGDGVASVAAAPARRRCNGKPSPMTTSPLQQVVAVRAFWGAQASSRATSGVSPENLVRRDAEHHTRGRSGDAYAPQTFDLSTLATRCVPVPPSDDHPQCGAGDRLGLPDAGRESRQSACADHGGRPPAAAR